jgi:hypothetical protein
MQKIILLVAFAFTVTAAMKKQEPPKHVSSFEDSMKIQISLIEDSIKNEMDSTKRGDMIERWAVYHAVIDSASLMPSQIIKQ